MGCPCRIVAQHSWFQWQQNRIFGAFESFLALHGSTAWVYGCPVHPAGKGRHEEGTGRCLSSLANNPHLPSSLFWHQPFCHASSESAVNQLICRVQPQPRCFLGWTSPHPTPGVHEQRHVGGLGFGKLWQVPHTCQRFWKSRFGSMALRISIATA